MNGAGVNDIVRNTGLGQTAGQPRIDIAYNNPNNEGFFNILHTVDNNAPYHVDVADLNQDGANAVADEIGLPRPATIIKSHCLGLNRNTSAPKRAKSCLLAPVAISSIPQQAVAKGMGHKLFLRPQLAKASSLLTNTLSGSSIAIEKHLFAKRKPTPRPTVR